VFLSIAKETEGTGERTGKARGRGRKSLKFPGGRMGKPRLLSGDGSVQRRISSIFQSSFSKIHKINTVKKLNL
jgi:hypothetical protein